MSPQAPDHGGSVIAGRYRLGAVIGDGGFGRVYRALDKRLGVPVAVKVIHPWWAQDPEWIRRFAHVARTAAQIGHTGVVRVTDTGIDPEVGPYTATRSSTSHTIVGTPSYMAREQVQGKAAEPADD